MTKDDFVAWKANTVTKAFFRSVLEKEEGLKELLAVSAGLDPRADAMHVGAIQALRDITDNDWVGEDE